MALVEKGISKATSDIYLRDTTGMSDHKGQARRLSPVGLPEKTTQDRSPVQLSLHHDLSEIKDIWLKLQTEGDCYVFQSYEWLSTWLTCIGEQLKYEPAIVIGRSGAGEVLFMLPLAIVRSSMVHRLAWLGTPLADYNAPLLSKAFRKHIAAGEFKTLWREILRTLPSFDVSDLSKQPELVSGQRNPMLELSHSVNASGAHSVSLVPDFDELYADKKSKSGRARERKRERKLAEAGPIDFLVHEEVDEIKACINRLIDMKTKSFAAMGVANIFEQNGNGDFYRALATQDDTRHITQVTELRVNDECQATNWGIVFKGRYYYVMASYVQNELSRFAPGTLQLNKIIKWAAENNIDVFDFTIGDERYKLSWADSSIDLYDHLSANSLLGLIFVAPHLVQRKMKRFIKQTPALWEMYRKARAKVAAVRAKLP